MSFKKKIINDSLPCPLVTPDVLCKARARSDLAVSNYNSFSVDFDSDLRHHSEDVEFLNAPPKICESALDLVGRTPMVRLSRLAAKYGLQCELVAKCEFLSIGGSVKDRIGKQMIIEAENSGRLTPGASIVEATSGNTGVALCMAAALKGYRCVITLPEKMSTEKLNTMAALGGEIVRTPTEAPWNSLHSNIGLAVQLQDTLPNCHFLDQYSNAANPRAHYLGTAEEILYQCDNKIDVMVMTVGTGGTLSGVARKLKEKLPACKIVGVDPKGSILAEPDSLNDECRGKSYLVEGIGYDFIPSALHRNLVDEWIKTDDEESLRFARELIRLEGLLVGGSSGSAIVGALKAARHLGPHERCVVLLADSARNYMTKFIADDWMVDKGFYSPPPQPVIYGNRKLSDVASLVTRGSTVAATSTIGQAIDVMSGGPLVVLELEKPIGFVTENCVSSALVSGRYTMEDGVASIMEKKFHRVLMSSLLVDVARKCALHECVVAVNDKGRFLGRAQTFHTLKAFRAQLMIRPPNLVSI